MDVALIGAALEENLALRYLAAPLAEAGHRVEIAGFDTAADREALTERLAASPPDVIGMSVAFQHRLVEFRELASALREAGVEAPIVWGGHIPTARSGGILDRYPEVDLIVRHDGEQTLLELIDALDRLGPMSPGPRGRVIDGGLLAELRDVEGLAFRMPGGEPGATPSRAVERDLDRIAPPLRTGRPAVHAGLPFVPILSSRGCWQHCSYCSIQTYHRGRGGPRVRLRREASVAEEMAQQYFDRGARIFCFHDENFFLPKPKRTLRRLGALRHELEERGVGRIGLVAKCRPDELSAEVLHEARDMGLIRVYVGVENGSQAGLDHLGRDTTVECCREALKLLRDAGVYACFNVLLFEPDTTLGDVEENLDFLRDACDFPWNFCRTEVYPGSFLHERLSAQGRLRGGLEGMTYTIGDPRVEQLFRICAVAFGGRNFGPQPVANSASGVGYLASALEWFWDGRQARAHGRRARRLIEGLGRDSLGHLEQALRFVQSEPAPAEIAPFAADLAARLAASDALLWRGLEDVRGAMERFGRDRARRAARPRASAKVAAAMTAAALSTAACDTAMVVDPVPPDVQDEVMVLDPLPGDVMVVDPLPDDVGPDTDTDDVMVMDPLPEDAGADTWPDDVMVVDPLPDDVGADAQPDDVMVVDPLPDDVGADAQPDDVMVVDPLPPDAGADVEPDDVMVVDPLPPDVGADAQPDDVMVVDPPPPDVGADVELDDVMVVDPPPPDVGEDPGDTDNDTDEGGESPPDVMPPVDPPPPDMGAADPGASPALAELQPLDRGFRVRLRVEREDDGSVVLHATAPDGARIGWRAAGGTIEARGAEATFVARGSGPAWVLAEAWGDAERFDATRVLLG